MDEFQEDEGKLAHGFTSVDALEEVDIGDGDRPRPTFISARLDPEYKQELVKLLKNIKIILLGSIMKCQVWIGLLLNIICLSNLDIGHISKGQDGAIQRSYQT